MFALGKGRLAEEAFPVCINTSWGASKAHASRLFSVVHRDWAGGHRHALKHGKLLLHVRRNLSAMRVAKCWHRLLREAMECPSLEMLKTQFAMVLGSLL